PDSNISSDSEVDPERCHEPGADAGGSAQLLHDRDAQRLPVAVTEEWKDRAAQATVRIAQPLQIGDEATRVLVGVEPDARAGSGRQRLLDRCTGDVQILEDRQVEPGLDRQVDAIFRAADVWLDEPEPAGGIALELDGDRA